MQDSVFSPPIALPPFSKRSPIKSGDFSNATVELVKLVRRKLVSVPLWHKLLFLKGVNLDLGILVMRLPTTQIACLGQLNVSVPLRGFWYADANCFKPHGGSIYRFSPLTGILVRRRWLRALKWLVYCGTFQSPYGDFGTPTLSPSTRSQTGLTGDFFKPPAFFVFFGDPGEKQKSGNGDYRLGYAICSHFGNFQTYGVFGPEIGFPKVSRTLTFL